LFNEVHVSDVNAVQSFSSSDVITSCHCSSATQAFPSSSGVVAEMSSEVVVEMSPGVVVEMSSEVVVEIGVVISHKLLPEGVLMTSPEQGFVLQS